MKKVDIGKEILLLHTKYIINDEKPKADFPMTGKRHLHYDELSPFKEAVMNAPRIGRIGTSRKHADELIAITRGLLIYLFDEASYSLFIHDCWMKGKLEELDFNRNDEDEIEQHRSEKN